MKFNHQNSLKTINSFTKESQLLQLKRSSWAGLFVAIEVEYFLTAVHAVLVVKKLTVVVFGEVLLSLLHPVY